MRTLPPVLVPVPIRCVSLREVPAIPTTLMDPSQSTEQLAAAARADIDNLEAYMLQADALLRACATEPVKP